MTFKKSDFIEIQFTGKVKEGEIFDSNIKSDLEKAKINLEPKPLVFSLGEGMFLKGIDNFLVGKDVGEYEIELAPEDAFGKREPKLVQIVPMRIFRQQNVQPIPGMMFNFDGRIAKILSVSGGRIIVDFNNPVAGKTVVYKIKILRKIEEMNEKISSLTNFFFKRDFKFEIRDKRIILEVEKSIAKFVELFADKFKEILGMDLEVKELEILKPEENTQAKSQ